MTGLTAGTSYTFTVTASNVNGPGTASSASNAVTPLSSASKYAVTLSTTTPAADDTVTVTAQLKDDSGANVAQSGLVVTWSKTAAGGSFASATSTTNSSGVATVAYRTSTTAGGSGTITATTSALTGTSPSFTVQPGTPTAAQSTVVALPTSVTADGSSSSTITVTAKDVNGNTVPNRSIFVTTTSGTLSAGPWTTDSSGVANATLTAPTSAGSATVTAYLGTSASATQITQVATVSFTPGVATQMQVFSGAGQSATVGMAVANAPKVQVLDANNNGVRDVTVTFAVQDGGGSLGAPATVLSDANGIATAPTWTLGTAAGTLNNEIRATSPSLGASYVQIFASGTPSTASQLLITTQPEAGASGATLTQQPVVRIADQYGNTVTSSSASVSVTSSAGGVVGGSQASGKAASAGVATFTDLTFAGTVGANYRLTFASAGLASATSELISVTGPGTATKLAFTGQPSTVQAGALISPAVQVSVQDSAGNTVAGATDAISLAIGTNPGSGTLSGTVVTNAVNGVATASNLSINKTGVGYTLTAASGSLTSATSSTFNVTAGDPAGLVVTRNASSPTGAGSAFTTAPQVSVRDGSGNVLTTDDTTIISAGVSSGGTLIGTTSVQVVNGTATFTGLGISGVPGSYTLSFTAPSLGSASQSGVVIQVGAPDVLDIANAASGATYGAAFTGQPVVSVRDAAGNAVTTDDTTVVTATVTPAAGGASVATATSTASSGIATFTGIGNNSSIVPGTYQITYTATGLVDDTQLITVAPATPTTGAWANQTKAYGAAVFALTPPTVNGVYGASGLSGSWTYASSNATVAAVSGSSVEVGVVGTATITGTFTPASANYTTTTATMTVTVIQATQATLVIASPTSVAFGTAVTLVTTGGSGSGPVTYGVVAGGTATGCNVTGTALTATSTGTCVVSASKAADANYVVANAVNATVTFVRAAQTVAFTSSPPMMPRPGGTYSVAASASSGLPVTLTITAGSPAVCTLGVGVITFNQAGSCVVTAAQAGDGNYLAATSVTQTIEVGALNQAITFAQPPNQGFGDPDLALGATASSGLTVAYALDNAQTTNAACAVSASGVVTIQAVGACAITVTQAGNAVYAAASPVTRVFQVVPVPASAPYILSVSVQNAGATVTFTPPGFTGGANVTGYQLNAIPDGGGATVSDAACGTSGTPLTCTMSGLANGAAYRFTVQAITAAGLGVASPSVPDANQSAITSAVRPNAVSGLIAVRGDTTLRAEWQALTPAQLGGGTWQRYELRIAVAADDSTVATTTINTQTDDDYLFTGLTNGLPYTITVVAISSANATALEGNTATVTEIPARAPDTVVPTFTPTSGTTATVSWPPPVSDGGSPVTLYTVTVTGTGGPFTCTATPPVRTCGITGLTRGATYAVTMSVTNAVGSSDDTHSTTQPNVPAPPVITAAAPATVDDSVGFQVTWTAPANNGAPITGYQVTATRLAGRSAPLIAPRIAVTYTCTSSTTSCIVFAPGSVRDYSYVVNADNLAGAGPDSAPFVVPDPTPPGPGPVPPGPTPPSPQPPPGPVPPGTTVIEVDGQPDRGATAGPNPEGTGLDVRGEGYSLRIEAKGVGGLPVPLVEGTSLLAYAGERIEVSGSGFRPGTYTATFVLDPVLARQGRALGAPVRLGTVLVASGGAFTGSWRLPPAVVPGQYILQVVGTLSTGSMLTVDTGLIVRKADRRSITITGSRGKAANAGRVFVYGRTWDLNGEVVRARVKLQGQTKYATGASRSVKLGEFTWQRKTGKKVYVYFQSSGIRSNRIIVPSAKG